MSFLPYYGSVKVIMVLFIGTFITLNNVGCGLLFIFMRLNENKLLTFCEFEHLKSGVY